MSTQLITEDVWKRLAEGARQSKRPAFVAVAYFGKGASQMLKLKSGSHLVVDASDATVKNGLTHPAELIKMRRRGISVFSRRDLHAKVFVFDSAVFVGSANASRHSEATLQEAVARVAEGAAVRTARSFVEGLCHEELGPESLKRLLKIYRPPRFVPGGANRNRPRRVSDLHVATLYLKDYPDDVLAEIDLARKDAVGKKQGRQFQLDDFFWPAPAPFREGQLVVQIVKAGRRRHVSLPGRVVHLKTAGKRKLVYVFVERPRKGDLPFSALPPELRKILQRGGKKSDANAKKVMDFWQKKQ